MSEFPQNAMDILQAAENTLGQPRYYDFDTINYDTSMQKQRRGGQRRRLFAHSKTHTRPVHPSHKVRMPIGRVYSHSSQEEDDYDDDDEEEDYMNTSSNKHTYDSCLCQSQQKRTTPSHYIDGHAHVTDDTAPAYFAHLTPLHIPPPPLSCTTNGSASPHHAPADMHSIMADYTAELARQLRSALHEIARLRNEFAAEKELRQQTLHTLRAQVREDLLHETHRGDAHTRRAMEELQSRVGEQLRVTQEQHTRLQHHIDHAVRYVKIQDRSLFDDRAQLQNELQELRDTVVVMSAQSQSMQVEQTQQFEQERVALDSKLLREWQRYTEARQQDEQRWQQCREMIQTEVQTIARQVRGIVDESCRTAADVTQREVHDQIDTLRTQLRQSQSTLDALPSRLHERWRKAQEEMQSQITLLDERLSSAESATAQLQRRIERSERRAEATQDCANRADAESTVSRDVAQQAQTRAQQALEQMRELTQRMSECDTRVGLVENQCQQARMHRMRSEEAEAERVRHGEHELQEKLQREEQERRRREREERQQREEVLLQQQQQRVEEVKQEVLTRCRASHAELEAQITTLRDTCDRIDKQQQQQQQQHKSSSSNMEEKETHAVAVLTAHTRELSELQTQLMTHVQSSTVSFGELQTRIRAHEAIHAALTQRSQSAMDAVSRCSDDARALRSRLEQLAERSAETDSVSAAAAATAAEDVRQSIEKVQQELTQLRSRSAWSESTLREQDTRIQVTINTVKQQVTADVAELRGRSEECLSALALGQQRVAESEEAVRELREDMMSMLANAANGMNFKTSETESKEAGQEGRFGELEGRLMTRIEEQRVSLERQVQQNVHDALQQYCNNNDNNNKNNNNDTRSDDDTNHNDRDDASNAKMDRAQSAVHEPAPEKSTDRAMAERMARLEETQQAMTEQLQDVKEALGDVMSSHLASYKRQIDHLSSELSTLHNMVEDIGSSCVTLEEHNEVRDVLVTLDNNTHKLADRVSLCERHCEGDRNRTTRGTHAQQQQHEEKQQPVQSLPSRHSDGGVQTAEKQMGADSEGATSPRDLHEIRPRTLFPPTATADEDISSSSRQKGGARHDHEDDVDEARSTSFVNEVKASVEQTPLPITRSTLSSSDEVAASSSIHAGPAATTHAPTNSVMPGQPYRSTSRQTQPHMLPPPTPSPVMQDMRATRTLSSGDDSDSTKDDVREETSKRAGLRSGMRAGEVETAHDDSESNGRVSLLTSPASHKPSYASDNYDTNTNKVSANTNSNNDNTVSHTISNTDAGNNNNNSNNDAHASTMHSTHRTAIRAEDHQTNEGIMSSGIDTSSQPSAYSPDLTLHKEPQPVHAVHNAQSDEMTTSSEEDDDDYEEMSSTSSSRSTSHERGSSTPPPLLDRIDRQLQFHSLSAPRTTIAGTPLTRSDIPSFVVPAQTSCPSRVHSREDRLAYSEQIASPTTFAPPPVAAVAVAPHAREAERVDEEVVHRNLGRTYDDWDSESPYSSSERSEVDDHRGESSNEDRHERTGHRSTGDTTPTQGNGPHNNTIMSAENRETGLRAAEHVLARPDRSSNMQKMLHSSSASEESSDFDEEDDDDDEEDGPLRDEDVPVHGGTTTRASPASRKTIVTSSSPSSLPPSSINRTQPVTGQLLPSNTPATTAARTPLGVTDIHYVPRTAQETVTTRPDPSATATAPASQPDAPKKYTSFDDSSSESEDDDA